MNGLKRLCAASAITGLAIGASVAPATASDTKANVYSAVQHLIADSNSRVPWDGRYSDRHHRLCIETFNGTSHDIKQWRHGVPPGFYIKVCDDGNFYVNDGLPFAHMTSY